MLKIKWFKGYMNVAQQHWNGLEYCLLSKDNEQCYPFLYCKEFLLDVVWSTLYERNTDLYGFFYNPKLMPLADLSKTRILLRNKNDRNFDQNLVKSVLFLNLLEKELDFTKSKVHECADFNNNLVVALDGDVKWMHAPPMLSLYALLLRIGMGFDDSMSPWDYLEAVRDGNCNSICKSDGRYLGKALPTIRGIVDSKCARFLPTMKENWPGPSIVREWDIHENLGIVSLSEGDAGWIAVKRIMPQWYEKKD
jgi:hypothetical protein